MSDFLYKSVESFGSRIKGRPFHLDRNIPLSLLLGLMLRRATWLIRGTFKLLFLQRRIATVFMAKGVNLRGASLIRFGKGVTLERGGRKRSIVGPACNGVHEPGAFSLADEIDRVAHVDRFQGALARPPGIDR